MNETSPSSFPQRTRRCPEEDVLAAYMERRLQLPKQQQVEAHVSACPYCLEQVGFLLNVQDAELPQVPAALLARVAKPPSRPWLADISWRWAPATVALAGVLVVASVVMRQDPAAPSVGSERPPIRQQTSAPAPAVPTPVPEGSGASQAASPPRETRSQAQVADGLQLLEPRAGAIVTAESFKLRWTAVPRALFYEVRITTANGQMVWSGKVEREQVRVPADAGLRPGAHFAWVRAHLPEGRLIRAQAVSFTVQE
jgi:hypothetical protein